MEKACYSVDPESLQNHAHQEVQIFMLTLDPCETAHTIRGMHI